MEVVRQGGCNFLRLRYLFADVDETMPLFQLVDKAKELVDDGGIPVVFNYGGVPVRINPCVDTQIILQAWEINRQKIGDHTLYVVYVDGEAIR